MKDRGFGEKRQRNCGETRGGIGKRLKRPKRRVLGSDRIRLVSSSIETDRSVCEERKRERKVRLRTES